jgi:fructan beta-fructosidase
VKPLLAVLAGAMVTAVAQPQSNPVDYRPRFHFSSAKNWINDPSGLVYDGSEYHLFYQYNPFGDQWGHMSWGHSVSKDLNRWQQLPVALPEENGIMIFTGSAVIDSRNTSGFGGSSGVPMVAVYTGNSKGSQTQNIAYSSDRGRTWAKFAGNPVIDIHEAEFRDPMVFWHQSSQRWIMTVSLAKAHKVRFYASTDLKNWSQLSDFGPAGLQDVPNWECPNLFELPVAGSNGQSRWVLVVGVGDGAVSGGSGTQYFVGTFDGTKFVNENSPDRILWMDRGADFYAAQSWSNVPPTDGRRILVAWMNNWKYAANLPTGSWRGQMSYPRTAELEQTPDGIRLVQNPVREIESRRGEHFQVRNTSMVKLNAVLGRREWSDAIEIVAELQANGSQDVGIELRKGPSHGTRVGYDARKGVVYIDRTRSGALTIHPDFAARHEAPVKADGGVVKLSILLDRCSVEVFADGGRATLTDLIFPDKGDSGLSLYDMGSRASVVSLDAWNLK